MNTDKTNAQLPQTIVSVSVTDVRVGNLIFNDYGEIQPIYGVDEKSILTKVDVNGWSICFKPKGVPISEEWLFKFGFIKYGKLHDSYKLNPFIVELGILGNHYTFRKIMTKDESMLLKEMKCVHELQNLYFSITGSELQIGSITEH